MTVRPVLEAEVCIFLQSKMLRGLFRRLAAHAPALFCDTLAWHVGMTRSAAGANQILSPDWAAEAACVEMSIGGQKYKYLSKSINPFRPGRFGFELELEPLFFII